MPCSSLCILSTAHGFNLFHYWGCPLDHLLKVVSASVLVSCGCIQITINWWLKTKDMYSFTILEAGIKIKALAELHSWRLKGKIHSLPLPAAIGCWAFFGIPWFVAASLQSLSRFSHHLLLCVSLPRTLVIKSTGQVHEIHALGR